jgi:cytochrome c oxidase cbb3-type subunit III
MTRAHSIFIIALTLLNIAGALWLLWWTRRSRGEAATTLTTGHVWDEDLTELNNPLPRWWLWLFIITVAFGGAYLALYPGLGSWQGTLGWTSRAEHDAQSRANAARIEAALQPFAAHAVADLERDPAALAIGRNLFLNNCAACHGSDGGGAPGFPNLTDRDWLWGGDADTVVATISNGRMGVMPAWGPVLGERGVDDVAGYVLSLQGGAPRTVRETIEKGRNGTMPPHLARLGETRVKLLAAYVLSLGGTPQGREHDDHDDGDHDDGDRDDEHAAAP